MNIYINSPSADARINFLKQNPDLLNTPEEISENFRKKGPGSYDFIIELLNFCNSKN